VNEGFGRKNNEMTMIQYIQHGGLDERKETKRQSREELMGYLVFERVKLCRICQQKAFLDVPFPFFSLSFGVLFE